MSLENTENVIVMQEIPMLKHRCCIDTLTERNDAVVNCTPIGVKTKSKLSNFMIYSRIERYSDE